MSLISLKSTKTQSEPWVLVLRVVFDLAHSKLLCNSHSAEADAMRTVPAYIKTYGKTDDCKHRNNFMYSTYPFVFFPIRPGRRPSKSVKERRKKKIKLGKWLMNLLSVTLKLGRLKILYFQLNELVTAQHFLLLPAGWWGLGTLYQPMACSDKARFIKLQSQSEVEKRL